MSGIDASGQGSEMAYRHYNNIFICHPPCQLPISLHGLAVSDPAAYGLHWQCSARMSPADPSRVLLLHRQVT